MIKKIKKYIVYPVLLIGLMSCNSFLDIVPENVSKYEDSFQNKFDAEGVLFSLYGSIPAYNNYRSVIEVGTDEIMLPTGWGRQWFPIKRMWGGEVSTNNPIFNYWSSSAGTGEGKYNMYEAIRYCYLFLDNIETVPDLPEDKLLQWKGEANFLIAYYHFRILSLYGPIVIVDRAIPLNAPNDELYVPRSSYDDSVQFIVDKFNEAAQILPVAVANAELGKPTKAVAKSLVARVLLYAASPQFNGNTAYADFKNPDGSNLISQTFDREKWKKAMDANLEAINTAHASGIELYHSTINANNNFNQAILDNRYKIIDPWNNELIWGYSGRRDSQISRSSWQYISSPRTDRNFNNPFNAIAPTFNVVEQYYSKNGLPINEDSGYDYANRYTVKAGDSTAYLNRDREPRYYSSIGFDRGVYEFNDEIITLKMRKDELQGRHGTLNDYTPNGYLIKKMTHPQTTVRRGQTSIVDYPWPIIRLAELYLNYAESYFEYNGNLRGDALTYFNEVRVRAGIPTIDDSWSGGTPDYREIIRTERMIELMFEHHRYYDLRRWKISKEFLSRSNKGWNVNGVSQNDFYQIIENAEFDFDRVYFENNDLHPIPQIDIDANDQFVNNPNW